MHSRSLVQNYQKLTAEGSSNNDMIICGLHSVSIKAEAMASTWI